MARKKRSESRAAQGNAVAEKAEEGSTAEGAPVAGAEAVAEAEAEAEAGADGAPAAPAGGHEGTDPGGTRSGDGAPEADGGLIDLLGDLTSPAAPDAAPGADAAVTADDALEAMFDLSSVPATTSNPTAASDPLAELFGEPSSAPEAPPVDPLDALMASSLSPQKTDVDEEAASVAAAAEEEAARKAAEEEAARVAAEEEASFEEQEAARTKDEEERPIAEVGLDDDESEAVSGRDRAVSSSEETQRVEAGRKAAKNIQVVRMPGLDSLRRPIVVVNARAWPTEKEASDLAMADVKAALAPVVQNDYALVFDLKSGAEQSTGARMAMRLLSYYRFVHPQAKHAREWPLPDNVLTMRACSTLKAT